MKKHIFSVANNVSPNVSLPAKTFTEATEFPFQPLIAKDNVDFVICVLPLLKTFPNVPLFAPKEKRLVWTLASLERPLALLVESFKSCNFHSSWLK